MDISKINLLQDRVLISPIKEETTRSGIIIPAFVDDKPQSRGVVVAVGIDFDERITPGDIVHYRTDDCVKMKLDGEVFDLTRESGIFLFETPRAKDPMKALELLKELRDWIDGQYELEPDGYYHSLYTGHKAHPAVTKAIQFFAEPVETAEEI